MNGRQILVGIGCGALAGLVAGLLLFIVDFLIGESGSNDFIKMPAVGFVAGGILSGILVLFRRRQVQERRYWRGMGVLFGILAVSPRLLSYFLFLLFALVDDVEYGSAIAPLSILLLYLLVGGLVGGIGGLVGGTLFTRATQSL